MQVLTSIYCYIEKLTRRNAEKRNECSVAAYIMLLISIEKHGMRLFVLIKLCQAFSHLSQRFLLNKVVYMSKLSSQVFTSPFIYLNAKETQPFSIHFFFHMDHMRLIS